MANKDSDSSIPTSYRIGFRDIINGEFPNLSLRDLIEVPVRKDLQRPIIDKNSLEREVLIDINEIPETFLDFFTKTREQFGIINGLLYTSKESRASKKAAKFTLSRVGQVEELERIYFERHKTELEDIDLSAIGGSRIGSDFKETIDKFETRISEDKLDKLIMGDVVNAYFNLAENRNQQSYDQFNEPLIDLSLEELFYEGSLLLEYLKNNDVVSISSTVYSITPRNNNHNPGGIFRHGRSTFSPSGRLISTKQFAAGYRKLIKNRLQEIAKRKYALITRKIEDMQCYLDKAKDKSQRITERKYNEFTLTHVAGQEYKIEIDVPEYVINIKDEFYAFNSTKIFLRLLYDGSTIRIPNPPNVGAGYQHLFSIIDGRLCSGDDYWENYSDSTVKYPINDSSLPDRISNILKRAFNILTISFIPGETSDGYLPRSQAMNQFEAKAYAQRNNIDFYYNLTKEKSGPKRFADLK